MTSRIPIFYDRELKPEWIDYALELYIQSTDSAGMRQALRDRLAPEIKSPTSLRKTVSQLEQTVGYRSHLGQKRLVELHAKLSHIPADDRADVRLQVLVESNKFVSDCVAAIKKLSRTGVETFESTFLYDRMTNIYGDRGTIPRRVRYVLRTLANLGAIERTSKGWRSLTPRPAGKISSAG